MVERIRQICEERGISLAKLCADLDIPQTLYRWDTNKPSIDKVCIVAEYLGVSVDFLCDRTDVREIGDGSALDRAEREYIEDFRRLNEYDRETVLDLIARELARPAPARVLTLPRSLQAASAGVGVPLEAVEQPCSREGDRGRQGQQQRKPQEPEQYSPFFHGTAPLRS